MAIFFVTVLLIAKHTNKPSTNTTPKQILPELAKQLEIKPELRDSPYWSWVDKNKTILPLNGQEFFIGSVNSNGIGKYKNITSDDIEQFTLPFFQPIIKTSDTFFIQHGFNKNMMNSNDVPDMFGTIYGGFENGELKCIYSLWEKSDPFGRFFCGYIDQHQRQLQKDFLHLFPMTYVPGQRPPFLRVEKVYGDFALGNYAEGSGPGGYTFMAKKTAGSWQIVWKGQEIATCSQMQKYQIPKEIYGECYPDS